MKNWMCVLSDACSGGSGVGHHLARKSGGNMSRGLLFSALARLFVVRGPGMSLVKVSGG